MSALVLFDIDGTLLLSGGAGMRGMTRAFSDVFGVADAFAGVPIAGFTDSLILSRALVSAGIDDTPEAHRRFRARYLELLPEEIRKPGRGKNGLMPGVRALLEQLTADDRWHAALLTGNYEPAAHVKLDRYGIDTFFSWGAFGEDSTDRRVLAKVALERAAARGVPDRARDNAVVIGDTPHDVACAKAVGARAIAVATGGCSLVELQDSGADVVLPDLADVEAVIRLL